MVAKTPAGMLREEQEQTRNRFKFIASRQSKQRKKDFPLLVQFSSALRWPRMSINIQQQRFAFHQVPASLQVDAA